MKRILIFVSVLTCAMMMVSCLDGGGTKASFTSVSSFSYNDQIVDLAAADSISSSKSKNIEEQLAAFPSQAVYFYSKINEDGEYAGGFIYSQLSENLKVNALEDEEAAVTTRKARHRAYAEKPKRDNSYLVWNETGGLACDLAFVANYNDNCTATAVGMFVANTLYNAEKIREEFEVGDRLVLTVQGYLKDTPAGEAVSVVLAEKTAAKDSVMVDWHAISLDKIGQFDKIKMSITGTNAAVLPAFCMDDFTAKINLEY